MSSSFKKLIRLIGNYLWATAMLFIGSALGMFLMIFITIFFAKLIAPGASAPLAEALMENSPIPLDEGTYSTSTLSWVYSAASYASFVGIWIVVCLYLRFSHTSRPILRTVLPSFHGNTPNRLALGALIGFGMNALCIAAAALTGSVQLSFIGFNPVGILALIVAVFIQSSAEELLCRCYLYQRTLKAYGPVSAITFSSLLFAVLHLGNSGISPLALINIFLSGVVFALIVYRFDSPWAAFSAHASWNFCQNIIFGLPNSGTTTPFAIFGIAPDTTPLKTFAYNPAFGVEASVFATIVLIATSFALWKWGDKNMGSQTNIWQEEPSEAKLA